MCETMSSYEEEREKMATVAMQIVIHAGDARNLIMEALDCAAEGQYDRGESALKEAWEELRQAHIFQTEIVQSEAAGKKYEYSLLFTHAQDTVMTICTEMNLAKKMIAMYQRLDGRIKALEGGAGETDVAGETNAAGETDVAGETDMAGEDNTAGRQV